MPVPRRERAFAAEIGRIGDTGEFSVLRRRHAKRGVFSKSENELRCFNNGIGVKLFENTCPGARIGADFGANFAVIPRVMRADVHRT